MATTAEALEAQTKPLDRWPDGSIRWLLIDGFVDRQAVRDGYTWIERRTGTNDLHARPGISVTSGHPSGEVIVNTGTARFVVAPGSAFPFSDITIADTAALDCRSSVLTLIDGSGRRTNGAITRTSVEESGALRAVVKLEGTFPGSSVKSLHWFARFHFFAQHSTVRILLTVRNSNAATHAGGFWDLGDPGSSLIRDLAIKFAHRERFGTIDVSLSPEQAMQTAPVEWYLYQDSSGGDNWRSSNHINRERRVPTSFRGYRMQSAKESSDGLRATPIVRSPGMALSIPEFWQNFPQAIEADGNSLVWKLLPDRFDDLHEIQAGEQKTFEAYLTPGSTEGSLTTLEWCRSRLVACPGPEWTMSTRAIPFLAPLDSGHAAMVQSAIEGPDSFVRKREVIDQYGWRHFGEVYGDHESVRQKEPPVVSHYNNQYDAVAGFLYQWLRTGHSAWWQLADEYARHVIDIDIYHTQKDKSAYNGGLFWHTYHYGDADTATHRTYPSSARGKTHGGGPSADHNYTTGLMLHHFLTGSAASREAVIGLGRYVIDMDDGRRTIFRWLDRGDTGRAINSATGYYGPGRAPANSLNALVDAHRLSGDPSFLAKADQLVRRVVHPNQDIAALTLDNPETRWFYTMFLQALGKWLHYKVERQELDASYAFGRDSLRHFAGWMLTHEHPYLDRPERLEFPTETWPAQDIRKSDVFFLTALHSEGAERAKFMERGQFFREYSLKTVAEFPTRNLARPVVILLTSGFLGDWFSQNPDAAEPAPRERTVPEPFVAFVPQRQRAEGRLKMAVAGAMLTAFAGVIWLVL